MKNTLDEQIAYVERVIEAYGLTTDHNEKADALEMLNDIRDSLKSIPYMETQLETEDI